MAVGIFRHFFQLATSADASNLLKHRTVENGTVGTISQRLTTMSHREDKKLKDASDWRNAACAEI